MSCTKKKYDTDVVTHLFMNHTLGQWKESIDELLKRYEEDQLVYLSVGYEYGEDVPLVEINYYRPYTEKELEVLDKAEVEQNVRDRAQWERLSKKYGTVGDV